MRIKYWVIVLLTLIVAQCLSLLVVELVGISVIEPLIVKSIRQEFDQKARLWHQQLSVSNRSLQQNIDEIQTSEVYEIRVSLLDMTESREGIGIPGIYYVLLEGPGLIVNVVVDETHVAEFGPIPGTFLQSNVEIATKLLIHGIVALVLLMILFLPYSQKLKRFADIANRSLGVEERARYSNVLDQLCDGVRRLSEQVETLRSETATNIENQRDFLHGVAHEFRAPLARLRFALDILDDEKDQRIEEIVEDMDARVTEILQYSRFRHGLFSIDLTMVDVFELLQTCVNEFKTNTSVKFELGESLNNRLCNVETDRALLKRCVVNILHNAMQYANRSVFVDVVERDKDLAIIIEDDGPGIPPGKRQLVFEAFTRLDPSRSRTSGGTGLGLAIVDGIAIKLGGQACVAESTYLAGARIELLIPKAGIIDSET